MKRQGLWKNTDFMRFWLGQSVSQFGNQVTVIALPAIAIRVLHASVFTVGLLVGVWVDKLPRKPIMVACNIGRLASLASIPLAFYLNGLTMAQLFIIAGLSGVFTVFFDVSYQSYLPSLVESSDLLEGNSKLQTSASAAQVSGPTIAGALIGFLGAAVSVLVDIAGYVVSVLAMLSIRKSESIPQAGPGTQSLSFRSLLSEGVTLIIHTRILAILTLCITISNFGNTLGQSVYLYYALTTLHLSYFQVGLIGTSGGLGLLFGLSSPTGCREDLASGGLCPTLCSPG